MTCTIAHTMQSLLDNYNVKLQKFIIYNKSVNFFTLEKIINDENILFIIYYFSSMSFY